MFSFFLQRSNYAINKSCCEIIFLFSFHFETRRVYIANIDMIKIIEIYISNIMSLSL
jgi:hypothetical protein